MPLNRSEAEAMVRTGIDALRRGDARAARAQFEEVVASGAAAPPWFLLAQACRVMRDDAGETAALDAVLATEARNIGALIMKGDSSARADDHRAAGSFYRKALNVAAQMADVPPGLQSELVRVGRYLAATSNSYQVHLESRLAQAGFDEDRLAPRMKEALAILTGQSAVYLQQPTSFFFPRLPHIQYYEREAFGWVAGLEARAPEIERELRAFLVDREGAFRPYVEAEPNRPRKPHSLFDDPNWSALHLSKGGTLTEHATHFPATIAALERVPLPRIAGRSPMILFSMLRPGTHIEPHNGMLNTRLICHLPLIAPPGCTFRVGNETRTWEKGKLLIFDDSIEHEAWSRSDQVRIILLFEIWRPELSAEERASLTTMYEAIDSYEG